MALRFLNIVCNAFKPPPTSFSWGARIISTWEVQAGGRSAPSTVWTVVVFFCVPSHLEIKKQVSSRGCIAGQRALTEKTDVLVLTLHPPSCITRASTCPLGPTGHETETHLAPKVNDSTKGATESWVVQVLQESPSRRLISHLEASAHFRGLDSSGEDPKVREGKNPADYVVGYWRGVGQGRDGQRSSGSQT